MKNEIIDKLIKEGIPEKISKKEFSRFRSEQDRKDFVQEMYLILLEMPESKIMELSNQGDKALSNYFSVICINQITNQMSNWNKLMEYGMEKISYQDNKSNDISDSEYD